jgi:hypothetical protein
MPTSETQSLAYWNWGAAVLHLSFAIWAITLPNKKVSTFKFTYAANESPASDLDYTLDLKNSRQQSLRDPCVAFFAMTSFAHVLYATDFFGRGGYLTAVLEYGWNPWRWIEYSITAGIMIYIIALVAGAKEDSTALVAALIVPGLMLQGLTVEREIQQNTFADWTRKGSKNDKPDIDPVMVWSNFAPAWFFFALKWYIIFNAYLQLKRELKEQNKDLDPRISQLVLIQFVAFTLFGIVQTAQVYSWVSISSSSKKPKAPYYITYEKAYIALSFVAKAALGISVARLLKN